jgi:hypothetical protein
MASRITVWRSAGVLLIAGLLAPSRIPVTPSALAQSKAKTQTVTGFVGDTTCGITHISGSSKTCTLRCVKNMGAKYALVVGKTVYTLEGKEAELEKLAGERAKVTGVIQGTTLKVSSVASGKFTEAPDMD